MLKFILNYFQQIHIAEMHIIFESDYVVGILNKKYHLTLFSTMLYVWYLRKLRRKLHANKAMKAIRIAFIWMAEKIESNTKSWI